MTYRRVFFSALISLICAGMSHAGADTVLSSSFESDLDGWKLILNRGAQARATVDDSAAAMGSACLRVTPIRLAAPDDRELATNIHLRYETLTLRAGTEYVMSLWMRAARDTRVQLAVRRMGAAVVVGQSWMAVPGHWRRLEMTFR
ncbi:MAG: carbohydrate binding domain-containing protein, partial [Armatimonadetes bacterium]|nr:carbohydrate binding domain-containing protein [Armatimonadota bacterium]